MSEKEDIVTSFRVSKDLWKEARKYSIDNDTTMRELLEKLLRIELEKGLVVKNM